MTGPMHTPEGGESALARAIQGRTDRLGGDVDDEVEDLIERPADPDDGEDPEDDPRWLEDVATDEAVDEFWAEPTPEPVPAEREPRTRLSACAWSWVHGTTRLVAAGWALDRVLDFLEKVFL